MSWIFEAFLWALAIAGIVYLALEWKELISAARHGPRQPVSGTESMVGSKALLTQAFVISDGGAVSLGRVQIDGEDWAAEWAGDGNALPRQGAELTIVEVKTGPLKVCVK